METIRSIIQLPLNAAVSVIGWLLHSRVKWE